MQASSCSLRGWRRRALSSTTSTRIEASGAACADGTLAAARSTPRPDPTTARRWRRAGGDSEAIVESDVGQPGALQLGRTHLADAVFPGLHFGVVNGVAEPAFQLQVGRQILEDARLQAGGIAIAGVAAQAGGLQSNLGDAGGAASEQPGGLPQRQEGVIGKDEVFLADLPVVLVLVGHVVIGGVEPALAQPAATADTPGVAVVDDLVEPGFGCVVLQGRGSMEVAAALAPADADEAIALGHGAGRKENRGGKQSAFGKSHGIPRACSEKEKGHCKWVPCIASEHFLNPR